MVRVDLEAHNEMGGSVYAACGSHTSQGFRQRYRCTAVKEAEARALMVIRRCRGPLERLVAALEREETLDRAGIEACLGTP